jgi:hypothetical protein
MTLVKQLSIIKFWYPVQVSELTSYQYYISLHPLAIMSCPSVFHNTGCLSCMSLTTFFLIIVNLLSSSVATVLCLTIVNIGMMLNDEELFGQSHPHVPTQSQGHSKISKKRLQTFVVSQSRHYKIL